MALVGWWPLDGNTNDYTVNQNNGVNTNVTFVNGKIGQAYFSEFISSSVAATVPGIPKTNMTISYWVKISGMDGSTGRRMLFLLGPATTGGFHHLLSNNGNLHAEVWSNTSWGDGPGSFVSNIFPENNVWYHITHTLDFDNSIDKIYRNGVLFKENPFVKTLALPLDNSVIIGGNGAAISPTTNFIMNDVRLYDYVLSQKEINDLAKAKVLNYNFNKDDGAVVYDSSGLKNNGEVVGPIWTNEGYDFDGINNKIEITPKIFSIDNQGTFSAWFKTTNLSAQALLGWGDNVTSANYGLIALGGTTSAFPDEYIMYLNRADGTDSDVIVVARDLETSNSNKLSDNLWHHVVVRITDTTKDFFVDGIKVINKGYQEGNETIPNAFLNTFEKNWFIRIGLSTFNGGHIPFKGLIDDVQIYATALSDADILDLYQTRAKIDNQGNLYANEFVEASLQEDIITNGLVLHLDASNSQSLNPSNLSTWSDLSGNNINFSLVGSVSYQNNYGGSVKGFGAVTTNYYATTDTSKVSLLPLGNSNRTIFTVIRTPDIYPANHNHIFHYGTPATDQAYGLTLRYNQSASGFVEGLATHPWSGSPTTNVPVPKSKPQTLAATYNSSNSKHNFYIEGALVPSNSDFRALNTVATEARIGMRLSTPAEGLGPTGEIIAILIYDRTLSDSEIKVMHDILKNRYKSGPNSRGQMITREFSEVDSPSQEMKIFKDKIHIQGSLNEGGQ
jgi:hypothetical protein